jgi:hypothetical protein
MEKLKREGAKRLFLVKIPTLEKCRFTVPPAVALLNYISSGILWRIFCQAGIFRGVFSTYVSFISLVQWDITRGPILLFLNFNTFISM